MSDSTSRTAQLSEIGVSIWLDDLSRERIVSGGLVQLIADRNVVGITTNPTISSAGNAVHIASIKPRNQANTRP